MPFYSRIRTKDGHDYMAGERPFNIGAHVRTKDGKKTGHVEGYDKFGKPLVLWEDRPLFAQPEDPETLMKD